MIMGKNTDAQSTIPCKHASAGLKQNYHLQLIYGRWEA